MESLAEECAAIGKELLAFTSKYTIDIGPEPEPEIIPLPLGRARHKDEFELAKQIRTLDSQIINMENAIKRRKDEEKYVEEAMKEGERRRKQKHATIEGGEQTRAKSFLSKLKSISKRQAGHGEEALAPRPTAVHHTPTAVSGAPASTEAAPAVTSATGIRYAPGAVNAALARRASWPSLAEEVRRGFGLDQRTESDRGGLRYPDEILLNQARDIEAIVPKEIEWIKLEQKAGILISSQAVTVLKTTVKFERTSIHHELTPTVAAPTKRPTIREDELELKRLRSSRSELRDDLGRVTEREERSLAKEKDRIRKLNERNKLSVIARNKLREKRKGIETLAKAIEFEWNKQEVANLEQKLDKVRNMLYSEVMLNIQMSVSGMKEKAEYSDALLIEISATQSQHHAELQHTSEMNHMTMETTLQAMGDTASQRHDATMQAINAFADILKASSFLFPALPRILTQVDPSLKPAAMTGYDAIESAVLSALYFRRMDVREELVHEAHRNTFSWIFEDPEEHQKPWSNFRRWLENGSGCYWISGKAGCGKSTLLKFLRSDPRTRSALLSWSGSSPLITASHFFWMAGSALQKNQEGLLRCLLHTILKQRQDLIARVFPKQYDAMMTKCVSIKAVPSTTVSGRLLNFMGQIICKQYEPRYLFLL